MNPIHKITGSRLYTQLATTRKARIVGFSAVLLTVAAFGAVAVAPMAPDASDLPVRSIAQNLEMPDLSSQITALEQVDQNFTHEEKVRAGDTLATLLTRLGVDDPASSGCLARNALL